MAHCILNQNSKIDACAHYPGAIKEAVQTLLDAEVGLLQMPCPELLCLGLDRQADPTANSTVESEDTRVAQLMLEAKTRRLCKTFVDHIVYQIEEYLRNGFQIVGLIGINGSPTCGVDTTWSDDREYEGYGVFIELLVQGLKEKAIALDMVGIKAKDPAQAVADIKALLK